MTKTEVGTRKSERAVSESKPVSDRRTAEGALQQADNKLQARFLERSIDLLEANEGLKHEMAEWAAAEKQIAELLQIVVTSQEDERRRIARDIHDQLGQRVTALRLQMASICEGYCHEELFSEQMKTLMATAEALDSDVSFLAWELRPALLDNHGLVEALREFINGWSYHYEIEIDFISRGFAPGKLTPEAETQFYRIAQEALNNVAKHAGADRVSILLEASHDQVSMIIEDNGLGFDSDAQEKLKDSISLGLVGMKERALIIGGSVAIESTTGSGTTIYLRAPAVAASHNIVKTYPPMKKPAKSIALVSPTPFPWCGFWGCETDKKTH